MLKTCSFGEIVIRLVPFEKNVYASLPDNIKYSYYGPELSFLVNIANLGAKAFFVSALPDNFIGHSIIRQLDNYRVNRTFVKVSNNCRVGVDFIEEGISSRPTSIIYDRKNSAVDVLNYEDYSFNQVFEKTSHYYISGGTPGLSEKLMHSIIHSARLAKEMGLEVSFNLNYNERFWKYKTSGKKVNPEHIINDIAVYCDYIFFNEYDIRHYFNIDIRKKENVDDIIVHYQNLLLKVSKKFPHVKVIAMLAKIFKNDNLYIGGVLYIRETNQFFFSPNIYNQFEPIAINLLSDISGEREAFDSGLVFALNKYKKVQQALDFAVASSVLKYTYPGNLNYSTNNEITSLMHSSKFSRNRRT